MTEETTTEQTAEPNGPEEASGIALFNRTDEALALLQERLKDRVYDIATVKGMEEAKKDRAELRTLRVNLDKMRKSLNEDDQARIKARNTRAGEITAKIEALEDPIDEQIKAEETRKAEARAEREREEQQRLASITAEIGNIQRMPLNAVGADAEALQLAINNLVANTLEQFDDVHLPTAQQAKDEALTVLNRMLAERRSLDEQQAAIAQQQQELAAQQAQAAQEAAEREAQAQRDREAQDAERDRLQGLRSEISGIQQQAIIAQSGRLGVRKGGTAECARETLAETLEWPIEEDHFGELFEAAKHAKDEALASIRETLAAAEQREETARQQTARQAELDAQEAAAAAERAERERVEAEQREADAQREREAQAERDRLAEAERQQAEADRLTAEEDARKARIENATLRSAAELALIALEAAETNDFTDVPEAIEMLKAALAREPTAG